MQCTRVWLGVVCGLRSTSGWHSWGLGRTMARQTTLRRANRVAYGTPIMQRRLVTNGAPRHAPNLYKRLEVSSDATGDELKTAYRRLALQWHPDVVAESQKAEAEVRFRAVSEAYATLSDPEQRRRHDEGLGLRTTGAAAAEGQASRRAAEATRTARTRGGSPPPRQPPSPRQERRTFVRGDANRVFAAAFDGKTLEQLLFEARRQRRRHGGVGRASRFGRGSEASAVSDGPAGPEAVLRHVLENAAEAFAAKAQRLYGPSVVKQARFMSIAHGPQPAPSPHMPFRPFVNMPPPHGVTAPPEPRLGPLASVADAGLEVTRSEAECDFADRRKLPLLEERLSDGTPLPRGAALKTISKVIQAAAPNMGQLYSYHRPY